MKPIKTRQRYKCDFCRKTLTKQAMEAHEKICYQNPDRYCELCKNKGYIIEHYGPGLEEHFDCMYCRPAVEPSKASPNPVQSPPKGE